MKYYGSERNKHIYSVRVPGAHVSDSLHGQSNPVLILVMTVVVQRAVP